MAWKKGQKESGLTDREAKLLGGRHALTHMGKLGGLASAKSKGNISDHDYLVKVNRAKQEVLKASIANKLAGK